MASATLETMRVKVRRLTHSPSPAQISDAEIDQYINTFYQYDFPEHLRLFTNLVNFYFFTKPNEDTYDTNGNPLTAINTLSDFKNRIINIEPPIYIDGQPVFYTQSTTEFYGIYPKNKSVGSTGLTGNGAKVSFSGSLSTVPVQNGSVSFTSVTSGNLPLNLIDDGAGVLSGDGSGTINYLTGAFTLTFTTAPGSTKPINFHVLPYTASRPQAVLYTANSFTLRPIPDDVYEVQTKSYIALTDFVNTGDVPELNQWWQYIAYGAAKKVFEDRADFDSVQMIMPEFKQQELLVLRRTISQQTSQRVATIYSEGIGLGAGGFSNVF